MDKHNRRISDEIYKKNEIDANKALTKGCVFSAVIVFIVWILYLSGVFSVSKQTLTVVSIFFPILVFLLLSTLLYTRTKLVEKSGYKFFLIIQFILVTFTVNVLIPKHGILLWATCIFLVNHYYSPKLSIITFICVAVFMFIGIYFGMLLGEWDANLMNGAGILTLPTGETFDVDSASFRQRVEWLDYLRDEKGDNRFLKAFIYYYLARFMILVVVANIGYALSKRTMKLLLLEVDRAENEQRIESELSVATSIQYSVLPKELNDDNKDNLFGLMESAKEVGGDLYDYFYIDEVHIALVIADVSGKGIPAALFMMKTEALIKSLTLAFKQDTAMIMNRINVSLCNNNEESVFVTCWLGILNLATGELKYTNAGHNKILIFHNGTPKYTTDKPGVVLGAFEGSKYVENTVNLEKNDKIVLYTDGVTEAHNLNNELYGEKRLLKYATVNNGLCPKDFVTKLRKDVESFSNGAPQFDDITILMFKYVNENSIIQSRIFEADVKELDNLFEYSSALLRLLEFSNRDIIMINTALEEIFVNVANYAYEEKGTVEITLSKFKDHVTFVFKDSGKPFNPLDKVDPNITAKSEEREIGGLGIFMVKKIMDSVKYEYVDNQNVLTLIKYKK